MCLASLSFTLLLDDFMPLLTKITVKRKQNVQQLGFDDHLSLYHIPEVFTGVQIL